ncbi:MAG: ADP-ribosylglycohydrolase family protein [Lachnospiraceae bacterium]|nr:ADP-ribosylglycohydrolase family protein [Lachnospiraceae bacterium]
MYGAILGDIIGSRFEFDRGDKTKDFELFGIGCEFTDDTVMTAAVAEALMSVDFDADVSEIEEAVRACMQDWGHRYPNAGYGGRFRGWLNDGENARPYGSYGNGSAMRVSAAGWLYDSIERTREVARATANVSHNHPEGIKGAESTAAVIYLARNGSSKKEIKEYVIKEFGYDLSRSCDEIRPGYHHVEDCQRTVPEAITAFLEGKDFEDVIRNAISLGGDTDTLGAIAGSMAEAFFGIPKKLKKKADSYLTEDILEVLDDFSIYTKPSAVD